MRTFISTSFTDDILIDIIPGEHYDVHVRDRSIGKGLGDGPIRMRSCYTKAGHYIGDEKMAEFLTKDRGLTQLQPAAPSHKVCSIGFSEKDNKWVGWSHRAIYGFGVGSEIKPGDCAFKPKTKEEWLQKILEWDGGLNTIDRMVWDGKTETLSITRHGSDVTSDTKFEPEHLGKGLWVIETLEQAREAAIDFAESVSSSTTFESTSSSLPRLLPISSKRSPVRKIKISLSKDVPKDM